MMAVGALLIAACSVVAHLEVGEDFLVFHVEGTVGGLPPGAQPLGLHGRYTDPFGHTVEVDLYDTDADGKPDHGVLPDGSVVKGELVEDGKMPLSSSMAGSGAQVGHRSGWMHEPAPFVAYENPPDDPMPVHFTKTVDQYLAEHGLEEIHRGENTASQAVELIDIDLDASLPSGFGLDVRLHWNTEAGWPVDIQDFPSLKYESYGLAEVPDTWPHYVQARVVGDSGAVLNWLAHFGVTEVHGYGVSVTGTPSGDHFFNHVAVVIQQELGLAQIALDSNTMTVALGW